MESWPIALGPPVVEMRGVTFAYDGRPVLEGVSFSVLAGDFVAVVGPNGGGKTTLIKLLLGMLRPVTGSISVLGLSPKRARTLVGYMPQQARLDPSFPVSVLDVVLMGRLGCDRPGRGYGAVDRQAALSALARVGLADLARRPFARLSGGQRQRVLIARALACQPRLLLLDEPTANLDPAREREVYEILQEINREVTVMVVSHDPSFVAAEVGTVLCVTQGGRVVSHPTGEITDQALSGLYGRQMRLVRHDVAHGHRRRPQ